MFDSITGFLTSMNVILVTKLSGSGSKVNNTIPSTGMVYIPNNITNIPNLSITCNRLGLSAFRLPCYSPDPIMYGLYFRSLNHRNKILHLVLYGYYSSLVLRIFHCKFWFFNFSVWWAWWCFKLNTNTVCDVALIFREIYTVIR